MTTTTTRALAVEPCDTHDWHWIEGSEYDRVNVELVKRLDDLNIHADQIIAWLTFHAPEILGRAIDEFEAVAARSATAL